MKKKDDKRSPEQAHDDREIAVGTILRVSGALLLVVGLSMAGMLSFTDWQRASEERQHEPPPPMATELPDAPPVPRLQARPIETLEALRAKEEALLSSYGWADREQGLVRVPIARAIEIMAARGLPMREQGPPVVEPVSQPTDASLGVVPHRGRGAP